MLAGVDFSFRHYLEAAGHGAEDADALFRPLHHSRAEGSQKAITPNAVYKIVRGLLGSARLRDRAERQSKPNFEPCQNVSPRRA